MEAYTFYYYLSHHALPSLATAQDYLAPPPQPIPTQDPDKADEIHAAEVKAEEKKEGLRLTPGIYLGGVGDLTGELMRLAIASVGRSLGGAEGESIEGLGQFVRDIKGGKSRQALHRWGSADSCGMQPAD